MLRFVLAGSTRLIIFVLFLGTRILPSALALEDPPNAGAPPRPLTQLCPLLLSSGLAKELLEWEFSKTLIRTEQIVSELDVSKEDRIPGLKGLEATLQKQGAKTRPVWLTRRLFFSAREYQTDGSLDLKSSRLATVHFWRKFSKAQERLGVRFEMMDFDGPQDPKPKAELPPGTWIQPELALQKPSEERRRPEFPTIESRMREQAVEILALPNQFPRELHEKFDLLRKKGFIFASSPRLRVPWYALASTLATRDLDPNSKSGVILIRPDVLVWDTGFLTVTSLSREMQHALDSISATEEFFSRLPRISPEFEESVRRVMAAKGGESVARDDRVSADSLSGVAKAMLDTRSGWASLAQYFDLNTATATLFSKNGWKEVPSILLQAMRLVGSHLKLGYHLASFLRLKRTEGTRRVQTGKDPTTGAPTFDEVPNRVWAYDEWLYYARFLGLGYACRQDVDFFTTGSVYQLVHSNRDTPLDGSE